MTISRSVPTAPSAGSSAWRLLSSEPHRLMFFFGAMQTIAAMGWWLLELTGRYAGWHAPIAWSMAPSWAHAWLLLYGVFPFFMFGFLMTAGPNWLGAPKMPRSAFVPTALLMAAGIALFYAGVAIHPYVVAAGGLVHAGGWAWGLSSLLRTALRHWSPNARYALVMFTFFGLGLAGSAAFAVSLLTASFGLLIAALHGAVWFFLLPIYAGVSTRMVPFFSSRVLGAGVDYKPAWVRPTLIACALAHGVFELRGAQTWLWTIDLPLACLVAFLSFKWGVARSAGVRLLAVLHISLAVLAAALLLYGIMSAALAAGLIAAIGYAPLHLLVIGYFAAMMMGMVSRVSLGHSGRALEADTLTWLCYLGVLLAAVLRAAAEFSGTAGPAFMLAAALVWLVSFGIWAARYMPMYLRPRVDRP